MPVGPAAHRHRSEYATANMFKELMRNNSPVDVAKALAAGGGGDDDAATGVVTEDGTSTARELLMRLPGINVHNYRQASAVLESPPSLLVALVAYHRARRLCLTLACMLRML